MKKTEIAKLLKKALLENGQMEFALFQYELEEHIDYWYKGLIRDGEEFVFVVTAHSGDVAMILITPDKKVYVNGKAREKLIELWKPAYERNIKRLIPMMAQQLANGIISVNGVETLR